MFTFSLQGRRDNVFSLAAAGLERDREAPSIIVWVMPVAFYPHVLLCLAVVAARTSQTNPSTLGWVEHSRIFQMRMPSWIIRPDPFSP